MTYRETKKKSFDRITTVNGNTVILQYIFIDI